MLKKFSDLGDPTLLLLGAFGVFFYLWSDDDRRRVAVAWGVTMALCVVLTIAAKLTFYLFGEHHTHPMRLLSPSGHVAVATAFYGGCAMILTAGCAVAMRFAIWLGASLLISMLAASRVMLGLHSLPEIVIGVLLGTVCLLVLAACLAKRSIPQNAGQLISLVLLIIVVRTSHVDGEALVAQMADAVRTAIKAAPVATTQFVRERTKEEPSKGRP